ncbi:hypothetical protein SUGI_0426800 [Cryptomeria japonica]|uniref:uncharacterized protein LOC131037697 n=1 Tax=Cryptomeria japonica TaxID=3369 RepID=UPI002408BDB8|nr:uncharacterized protein LOC131037697 [Cryptomeria japonica]GLJ22656.1 hypothetical protein SUGI_0426800 [Cryptomeria japonica]
MSAAVCGKRLSPFEGSPPLVAKRLRYSSITNTPSLPSPLTDNLAKLIALFPAMDPQLVEKVFESCDENMDHAIKSLSNLCLNPPDQNMSPAIDGLFHSDSQPVQGPGSERACDGNSSSLEYGQLNGKSGFPADGVEWAEFLVVEMKNASDLDDARARASRTLEAFEKTVMARSGATAEVLYKEVTSLKEQVRELLHENSILKRAVSIQHDRQLEQEEKAKELQQLHQLVAQYQERVKTLELNNYALTLHLRKAEEGSSIPGRFHPDVF